MALPSGLEPELKASEAFVLSVTLQELGGSVLPLIATNVKSFLGLEPAFLCRPSQAT
jgi:hypothetical protein